MIVDNVYISFNKERKEVCLSWNDRKFFRQQHSKIIQNSHEILLHVLGSFHLHFFRLRFLSMGYLDFWLISFLNSEKALHAASNWAKSGVHVVYVFQILEQF